MPLTKTMYSTKMPADKCANYKLCVRAYQSMCAKQNEYATKVQVGKDQGKAQSEKKNQGGKKN